MSAPAVTIVWVDEPGSDWVAIYMNGTKIYEGHPLGMGATLDIVNVDFEELTFPSERFTDHRRMRGMPASLSRV